MRANLAGFLSVLAVLAACERKAEAPPPPVEALRVAEVEAVDELGAFDARINAIAFWTHPNIPFYGLVIAASDNGLVALNIEDGEEVARIDGIEAKGLAVSYTGTGPEAQGYALISEGGEDGGFRLFAIDNATRELSAVSTPAIDVAAGDRGFCLARDETGEKLVLHQMRKAGWTTRVLAVADGAATEVERRTARAGGRFLACAADDVGGSFFVIDARGDIHRVDRQGIIEAKPFARSGLANPAAIAIAYNGLVAGGPTEECCGEIAVLNGGDGSVRLFDLDDGRALGQVSLKSSYDVDGVVSATAMALGAGNFGAVYRDGVLALATAGEAPALRLAPLNGVMDALSAPIGLPTDPRALGPQAEEETAPDFAFPEPANP